MKIAEIKAGLAALMYYQGNKTEQGKVVSFEELPEEARRTYLELAESVLVNLDKMNLTIVPATPIKNPDEVDTILQNHIEAVVDKFFAGITVWKKGAIPQRELAAQIFHMFKNL